MHMLHTHCIWGLSVDGGNFDDFFSTCVKNPKLHTCYDVGPYPNTPICQHHFVQDLVC